MEMEHLNERSGGRTAGFGMSLTIESGGICGFPGPSGAGKSAAMKTMTGGLFQRRRSDRIRPSGCAEIAAMASGRKRRETWRNYYE